MLLSFPTIILLSIAGFVLIVAAITIAVIRYLQNKTEAKTPEHADD